MVRILRGCRYRGIEGLEECESKLKRSQPPCGECLAAVFFRFSFRRYVYRLSIGSKKSNPQSYSYIFEFSTAQSINAYTRYTVVAEKFHAMVLLDMANSRMKDFFDIWMLNKAFDFDGAILCQAVQSTFERRKTEIPEDIPVAFSPEFSEDKQKQVQWKAFLRKTKPETMPGNLQSVLDGLIRFMMPVLDALRHKKMLKKTWNTDSGTWQ